MRRTASIDEVNTLAERLRPLIQEGDTVREFIRRNPEALRRVVEEKSWKTLAAVMTTLGMTFKTGTPWTGDSIQSEFRRSTTPFKERRGRRRSEPVILENDLAKPVAPHESRTAEAEMHLPLRGEPRNVAKQGTLELSPVRKGPWFEPFTLKDQEPPRELTPEERKVIAETQLRLFGKRKDINT